jgi:PHP family Zn ribbon phosphoesterase
MGMRNPEKNLRNRAAEKRTFSSLPISAGTPSRLRSEKITSGEKVILNLYRLDLHIHTVLSPCTEIAEMTPVAVVRTALAKGLGMVAVCDHNSARNTSATVRAAAGTPLTVIPGVEVTTVEEVHVLGLFPTDEDAARLQDNVYARLPGENDEEVFGYQVVVDEEDQVEDLDKRLLIGATTLDVYKVVALIHEMGGLAVAAHVDRSAFGIFSQLGFIPPDLQVDAVEISRRTDVVSAREKYPQIRGYSVIRSSDAHYLKDIGSVSTTAKMAEPSFSELKMALAGEEGRSILEEESD